MRDYLRTCERCGGYHLGHNSNSYGGRYWCRRCFPISVTSDLRVNDVAELIDDGMPAGPMHSERHRREYIVLTVAGDDVTVRQQGDPDAPVFALSRFNLWRHLR